MRSLRVLFLATRDWSHPGTTGGDNTLWEQARYLASVGHEVTYLAASYPGSASREKVDRISVVRIGRIHTLWFWSFFYYLSKCRRQFDVVVTEGFGGSRIPRLAPLYVKEPIITAWHQIHRDLFAAQYPWPLVAPLSLVERMTAWVHRDTYVQAYTEEWKDAFPSIGFAPDKVFVVSPSIREDWLVHSNVRHPTTSTVIWIGKLRRYKCPDHVIVAMATVVKQLPDAQLVLVGRHDDLGFERHLSDLVRDLGLTHNVTFRFNATEREKRRLLEQSSILVLSSAVEGFGIVVLEANACGRPVIASSGVPETVVKDGYNGLRYPFGQVGVLSDRIIELLTDSELQGRLSINSLAFAKEFSWPRVGREYENAVKRVFSDSRSHDIDQ